MNLKEKKYSKLNITLPQDFYKKLKHIADEEYLPVATFVKKYLLERLGDP